MEIIMTVAKVLTTMLALALSIALSPWSNVAAAAMSGARVEMPSEITAMTMKRHHAKRHHRHHRTHSKRGRCGTYMYYSKKKHHCLDARSK
jgi:hypothetical protein